MIDYLKTSYRANIKKINGKARIAWKSVCKSKQCGGLGFKPLDKWNSVLMTKHLWNVASKKDSLWVKWVSMYRLKERSVWDIPVHGNASWGWRKLMGLRNDVRPHIRHCLGNRKSKNVWHDTWCDVGSLDCFITRRQICNAELNDNKIVASMIENEQIKFLDH